MAKGILGAFLGPDPREHEIRAALGTVRKELDEYIRLRALNQRALRGQDKSCRFSPQELKQRLELMRDPEMERRQRVELYKLMELIYGRAPTEEEMQIGVPSDDGLGLIPVLLAAAPIVIGTAWGVSSITGYLRQREQAARGEREEQQRSILGPAVRGVFALGAAGGIAYGSYRLYTWIKNRPKALPEPEEADEEPEAEEEEE